MNFNPMSDPMAIGIDKNGSIIRAKAGTSLSDVRRQRKEMAKLDIEQEVVKKKKRAFKDDAVNDFFLEFCKEYPNKYKAFALLGIDIIDAKKLLQTKKYIEAASLAKEIRHLELKASLYKAAGSAHSKESLKAIETLVKMFDEDVGKNKKDDPEDEKEAEEIPYYLRNSANDTRMENEMNGLEEKG